MELYKRTVKHTIRHIPAFSLSLKSLQKLITANKQNLGTISWGNLLTIALQQNENNGRSCSRAQLPFLVLLLS